MDYYIREWSMELTEYITAYSELHEIVEEQWAEGVQYEDERYEVVRESPENLRRIIRKLEKRRRIGKAELEPRHGSPPILVDGRDYELVIERTGYYWIKRVA